MNLNLFLKHPLMAPIKDDDAGDAGGAADDRGDGEPQDSGAAEDKSGVKAEAEDEHEDEGKLIPKARFDEAVKKERDARERTETMLKEAEAKITAQSAGLDAETVEGEIADLEAAVDAAAADGDKDKVAALRKQIRTRVQALATAEATRQAAYATAVAVERVRYDSAVATLEAAHPEMNPDSETYDEELTAELIELKKAYEATGMGSTDALKKATKYVFKVAPAAVKKDEDPKDAAERAAKMKEEAIRRGLDLKARQPGDVKGKQPAKEVDTAAVVRMSDKEFNKLDEDEIHRLRGDTL